MKTFKQYLYEMPMMNDVGKEQLAPYEPDMETKKGMRKISDLKGHDIKKFDEKKCTLYSAHDKEGKVRLQVYGPRGENDKDFFVSQLNGYGNDKIKAHELYHHLVTKHGLKIHSGTTHSIGAKKTWEELHRNKDIKMESYDDTSKQYVDIPKGTSLEPYYRSHIRLVASKNDQV